MTQTLFSTQVVNNGAILHVTKTGSASAVSVGKPLVYTLSYDNLGNQTATSVRLTDTLPANLTVIAVSRPPDYQTAQKLAWNLSDLISSAQGQIVITTTVGSPGNRTLHNVVDMTGQPGSYAGHAELNTVVRPFSLYLPIVLKND